MILVFIEAGPQNVDLGLANRGGALVLNVVDVAHLLADVILDLVLVWERGREGIRLAGHPEISLHPDGDCVHLHVVTLGPFLGVGGVGVDVAHGPGQLHLQQRVEGILATISDLRLDLKTFSAFHWVGINPDKK